MAEARIKLIGDNAASAAVNAVGSSFGTLSLEILQAKQRVADLTKEMEESVKLGRGSLAQNIAGELDQAMPKLQALEAELKQNLKPALEEVEGSATKASQWMGDFGNRVASTAFGMVSAEAAIGALSAGYQALVGFVSTSITAAAEAEASQAKLTAALRQQGTAAPELIDQYNALASTFQRTTVYSDDLTNEMQALLVQVGDVMPSQMQQSLTASADLASGLGIDLKTATELVAKAAAGHTETLGRYGITVSDAELKSKGFDAVLGAINERFGGQAQAQAETYTGKVEQLGNAWNNLQEAVGRKIILDPAVLFFINALTDDANDAGTALDSAGNSTSLFRSTLEQLPAGIGPVIRDLGMLWDRFGQTAAQANAVRSALLELGPAGTSLKQTFTVANDAQRVLNAGMAESERIAKEEAEAHKKAEAAIKAQREEAARTKAFFDNLGSSMKTLSGEQVEAIRYYKEQGKSVSDIAQALGIYQQQVEQVVKADADAAAGTKQLAAEIRAFDREIHTGALPALNQYIDRVEVLANTSAKPRLGLEFSMMKGGRSLDAAVGSGLRENLGTAMQGLPQIIAQGVASGGGMTNALEGATSSIASALGKSLGSKIGALGSMGGPMGAAIGSLAGPAIDMLMKIGKPSEQELGGRKSVADFERSFGGFNKMMASLGDAYAQTGRSSAQAQADIKAMLDAEKRGPEATQAWIDKFREIQTEAGARTAAIQTGVQNVVGAFRAAGGQIPDSMRASIDDLRTMAGLTDDQRRALDDMTKSARPNFEQLEGMAKGYGISLEGLGPKFEQGRLEDSAKKIFDDFTALTKAGGDAGGILVGMNDEIQQLVNDSKKFGTAIPDNMKPLIENLIQAGKLTDDQGKKITDVSQLSWEATPLEDGVQTLVKSIQDLIDALRKDLPDAARAAADAVPDNPYADWRPPDLADPNRAVDLIPSYANEGYDLTRPQFARVGDAIGDSESVLHGKTVRQMIADSRRAGAAAGDGRVITALREQTSALVDANAKLTNRLDLMFSMLPTQLRDAMLLA